MMFKVVLFVYLFHLQHHVDGWSLVTSRPVVEPEPRLMTVEDLYDSQDVFRLSDVEVGLTAFKDKKLLSCFVNDYDPYWQPADDDKKYFLESQPCEKVNLNTDYSTLKKKAGPKIARLCKEFYVVWLAARSMGPPPLPGMAPQIHRKPCRAMYDDELGNVPVIGNASPGSEQMGKGANADSDGQSFNGVAPPVAQDGAPPMLPIALQQSLQDGAQLMSHDLTAQKVNEGVPPMIDEGAPRLINDGAPPVLNNGAPPMLHGGAPSILQDGTPPMLHDGAPPMLHDGAPPMLHDGAPPMQTEGAPPMLKESDMGPPPLSQGAHSRRNIEMPPMIKTPPPLNLLSGEQTQINNPPKAPLFRRMLGAIKDKNTIAPPTPDMKTPPPPRALFPRNV